MKYAAITSMNQKYYDHCGQAMLQSYSQHWAKQIPLFLYNEGLDVKAKNTHLMGWNLGIEYDKFQERWKENNKVTTFAKKGFSIIHAMYHVDCDRLIWLDADTICTRKIHLQLLDLIAPDNVLSSHFGVYHNQDDKKYFSCETGFFIINKHHPKFKQFRDTYTEIYTKDQTENIRRFYDGEVYGETVRRIDAEYMELNPSPDIRTPIPRSIISPYVEHYKAGLKDNYNNNILKDKHSITDEV